MEVMVSPLANAPYVYGLLAHQDVIIIIPTIFLISFQPDERNQVQMTHRVVQCNYAFKFLYSLSANIFISNKEYFIVAWKLPQKTLHQ